MNDHSLFAPSPRRKRGLILTLSGSLLFHGSLVGVAALWPTHPVPPPPGVTFIDPFEPPGEPLPPAAAAPTEPVPEPPPVLNAPEHTADQPPVIEPNPDDMSVATPLPPRAVSRSTAHPAAASTQTRAAHTPGSLSTGNAAGTAAIHAGGMAGGRWNTPKPVYPAPLRLARVQGSGSVRVTTDGSGRVTSATIVQSTGNPLLDDHTCRSARSEWTGPANTTTVVPITYRLQ